MDVSSGNYVAHQYEAIVNEMGEHNFEVIRFSSYRTAAKLRFIQQRSNFHFVDIWNTIESIRENGLSFQDVDAEMDVPKLEGLISSIYYQLSKRLPPSQSINLDDSIISLLTWLSTTYDPNNVGKVKVFAIKISLAILCSGKLIDKLRYIFTLISDLNTGFLIESRFNAFLCQSMALPCSVFESGAYQYDDSLSSSIFDFNHPIDLYTFMDIFLNTNSPPSCISWVVIFHRMAEVEFVVHLVQCEACNRHSFNGFRYKCQKCFNYNLCQDCFWRGRKSSSHDPDSHPCKEYAYYKTTTKQIGHSLRKSFRCASSSNKQLIFNLPQEPPKEKRYNLAHVVPPSPVLSLHNFNGFHSSSDLESLHGTSNIYKSTTSHITNDISNSNIADDEHRLIARYAACLAKGMVHHALTLSKDNNISQQQELIMKLETRNREIMQEIKRLRQEQYYDSRDKLKSGSYSSSIYQDPLLLAELGGLRQRKEELEGHLNALQESRRELMIQLEGLMKLLKNHGNLLSAISTGSNSASSSLNRKKGSSTPLIASSSGQSDTNSVASASGSVNRDLLVAADSVTNAMSSLVKELNTGDEISEELTNDLQQKMTLNENTTKISEPIDELNEIDEQRLAMSLFKTVFNKTTNYDTIRSTSTCITTDDESYIHTDDELDDIKDDWDKSIASNKLLTSDTTP